MRATAHRVPFKVATGTVPDALRMRMFSRRDWNVVQFEVDVSSRYVPCEGNHASMSNLRAAQAEITGRDVDDPVSKLQLVEECFLPGKQPSMLVHRILDVDVGEHFDLDEPVDTDDALGVLAIRASLMPKARREPGIATGHISQDLVRVVPGKEVEVRTADFGAALGVDRFEHGPDLSVIAWIDDVGNGADRFERDEFVLTARCLAFASNTGRSSGDALDTLRPSVLCSARRLSARDTAARRPSSAASNASTADSSAPRTRCEARTVSGSSRTTRRSITCSAYDVVRLAKIFVPADPTAAYKHRGQPVIRPNVACSPMELVNLLA